MQFNKTFNDGQTKAGAARCCAGTLRFKTIKDTILVRSLYAATAICHGKIDAIFKAFCLQ